MKDEVIDWYNALRQEWGLEQIGSEPEDTSSLILEDFIFRAGRDDDAAKTTELHKLCVEAEGNSYAMYNPYEFQPELSLVVETKSGDFAGYISGSKKDDTLHICTLEIVPEYRGLGLGKTLLARFLEKNESHPFSCISVDIPADIEAFAKTLRMEGFEACSCRFVKKR
jgi:ribosomal protein S18 acetylase RimI-like enzyme